jgi:O-antigen/teichoic acid export membrane protein
MLMMRLKSPSALGIMGVLSRGPVAESVKPEGPQLRHSVSEITPNPFAVPDVEGRVRLFRESFLNCSGFCFAAIVGVVMVPVMLAGLGEQFYGLWVVAIAVSAWGSAIFDFGLSWSVIREVAAAVPDGGVNDVERFVSAARSLYFVLAVMGALVIALLDLEMSRTFGLSPERMRVARLVFVIVAAGFIPSQMLTYEMTILQGLRRFDLANLLSISSVLFTALGTIAAIAFRLGIIGVTGIQALSAVVFAFAGYLTVSHVKPGFRQRLGRFEWTTIRSRIRFSLGSQLIATLNTIFWDAAPLLVAPILRPGAVAQYHVGRKFPQTVARLAASAGLVVLPAASGHDRDPDVSHARDVLEAGTRSLVVSFLPICILLWILAPDILTLWIGAAGPQTARVLRLVTITALLEAICTGPFNVLWGRGEVGVLVRVMGFQTAGNLALTVALLGRFGIVGAAWALLIPLAFATLAVVLEASRRFGTTVFKLTQWVTSGLSFPVIVCAASTLPFRCADSVTWFGLIFTTFAGGLAYVISFYFRGAREEEKMFMREALQAMLTSASRSCQTIRSLGRRTRL